MFSTRRLRSNSTAFHSIPAIRSKSSTSVLSTRKIRPIYSHPAKRSWWELVFTTVRASVHTSDMPHIIFSLPKSLFSQIETTALPTLPNFDAHFAEKKIRQNGQGRDTLPISAKWVSANSPIFTGETKGSPLSILFGTATFFSYLFPQRVHPSIVFAVLRQNGCWKIPEVPLSIFFRHCEIFFRKIKIFPLKVFDVLRQNGC